jgi:glycosyltransferase 2 family protein
MQRESASRWLVPLAFWLGLLAAVLALWLTGQAGNAWGYVRDARPLPLVLVVLAGMLLPVIHARRWQLVMRALGTDLPPRLAADLTVSASLVNYASPGYLGAPAKAFLANRSVQAPYSRSLVSMAFEQGLDFVVLLLGSALALLILGPDRLRALLPDIGRTAQVLALVAGVALLLPLLAFGRGRVLRALGRIRDAFRTLAGRVDRGAVALLTLAYWLAQVAVIALLLWALRLPFSATTVLALATIPLLAGQIAPLPGGVGAREAAIVALSGATGATASGLLGLAVLQRVLLVAALPLSLGVLRLAGALARGGAR